MEIWHREYSMGANVKVAARLLNTDHTNQTSDKVNMEHQKIKISSTVVREIQNIKFNIGDTGTPLHEIQVINIVENSGRRSSASYMLGLYGVYTSKITFSLC